MYTLNPGGELVLNGDGFFLSAAACKGVGGWVRVRFREKGRLMM